MQHSSVAPDLPGSASRPDSINLDESLLRITRSPGTASYDLPTVIREVARTLGADRAAGWTLESTVEGGSIAPFAHASAGEAAEIQPDSGQSERASSGSSFGTAEGSPLATESVHGIPATVRPILDASLYAEALTATRAVSLAGPAAETHIAVAGVRRDGRLTGCIEVARQAPDFSPAELAYLASVADRIALIQESADRQRAEDALADRQRTLDEVEELTNLGSWEWDLATDTITWSVEQLRIHGVDPSVRTQNFATFLERVHPDDRQRLVSECDRTISTGIPFNFPYRIVRSDGIVREMEALGKVLPGTAGQNARLVGISRDVTDRNAAERALRHSEESYRLMFQNATDGIWVHDVQTGEVIDINLAAAAMFGYTREEMLKAGHDALLYPGTEYTVEKVASYMSRAAAGETTRFEWLGRHHDGGEVWAEVTLRRVAIRGEDRILVTARDINERKAAERALQKLNEELETRVAERTRELETSNAALAKEVGEHETARDQLTRRSQELEAVFTALPDVYFRLSPDGRILDHRLGRGAAPYIKQENFIGERMQNVLPAELVETFEEALEEVSRLGELVCIECTLPVETETGDCDRSFEARLIPSADGSIVAIVRDITDRLASQEALRRSEEHFRALIENSSDFIMIVNAAGEITYMGPSSERILGYTPEETLGSRPEHLVHPEDVPTVYATLKEIFENPGKVMTVQFRMLHADKTWRVFETSGRTLQVDSGEAGVVANGRDITERKRAEDEIVRQKLYFEEILDSIDAGIAVFDEQGRFEFVTPTAIHDPEMRRWVIGKTNVDYGLKRGLPPEIYEPRQQSIMKAIRTGEPNQFEQEIGPVDGIRRMVLRRMVPITDENRRVTRLVGFSVDISDRKAAEVALHQAKEEAERANRAKSEFLSRMSHELRTPLNGILGFAQVLQRQELRADQQKFVGHILKGGKHLLQLINEVLELARIESGRISLSLEPLRIEDAVRESLDLVRPIADPAGIELASPNLPGGEPIYVHADRQRLVQVIINLISNAIKYNRPGGGVRLSVEPNAEDGYSLRVSDTGRGIPSDKLDQLFTPFARLGAEQTETEGTGLGLALSRRLAEAMGGNLVLESTGIEGSVFRLDLLGAIDPLVQAKGAEGSIAAATAADQPPATILYIEDNLTNLALVETFLEARPNLKTVSALRGQAGIDLAFEHNPDLILLDLHLPDVSGDEVLGRLRSDPRTEKIPIIVISADATRTAIQRLLAAGADDYLTKPLDLDEFLRTLEKYLPG